MGIGQPIILLGTFSCLSVIGRVSKEDPCCYVRVMSSLSFFVHLGKSTANMRATNLQWVCKSYFVIRQLHPNTLGSVSRSVHRDSQLFECERQIIFLYSKSTNPKLRHAKEWFDASWVDLNGRQGDWLAWTPPHQYLMQDFDCGLGQLPFNHWKCFLLGIDHLGC